MSYNNVVFEIKDSISVLELQRKFTKLIERFLIIIDEITHYEIEIALYKSGSSTTRKSMSNCIDRLKKEKTLIEQLIEEANKALEDRSEELSKKYGLKNGALIVKKVVQVKGDKCEN